MRKIYSKKKKVSLPDKNFTKIYLFFTLVLTIIVIVSAFMLKNPGRSETLKKLTVPQVSHITYPEPLILAQYETSVLGAATFNPVDIVTSINEERVKTGLQPLRLNTTLMKAARLRADTILKHQNFSHGDPYDGIELGTVLPKLNYHFSYATENIGMGGVSGPDFVNGFMHSTAHRENLLDPNLQDTGVAVVTGPYHQYYVNIAVQIFSIPAGVDEYLGYTPSEILNYKNILSQIDNELNPVDWVIGRMLRNSFYTQDRYDKLFRQREILSHVVKMINEQKPLTNTEVTLILEYNDML